MFMESLTPRPELENTATLLDEDVAAGGGLKLRSGDSLRQRNSKVPSSLTPTRREGKLIACATRGHGQGPEFKNGQSRMGRRPWQMLNLASLLHARSTIEQNLAG
jgi:hypothetical protein